MMNGDPREVANSRLISKTPALPFLENAAPAPSLEYEELKTNGEPALPPAAPSPQNSPPKQIYALPNPNMQQFQMMPPQPPMPRLAYPIIYQSAKPVATEPLVIDDATAALRNNGEPANFCDKFCHSTTTASNNFQMLDLIDVSDVVTFRCPRCNYEGPSRPFNTLGPITYFGIVAMCCICGPCGLAPCFIKRCQYVQHYCPQCAQKIGVTYPG